MIPAHKAAIDHTNEDLLQRYLSLPVNQREEEFPSTARAAAYVGVSRRTIQFWIEAGEVAAISIGRKYRVHLKSLLAHLRNHVNEQ